MANFKILSAIDFDPCLKLRIQNTGRVGFGEDTARGLKLTEETCMKFMQDVDVTPPQLYLTVLRTKDKDAFQVKKSGKYFYLTTTKMFDSVGIDYKTQTVFLEMVRLSQHDEELGGEVYRLDIRIKTKKDDNNEDEQEDITE